MYEDEIYTYVLGWGVEKGEGEDRAGLGGREGKLVRLKAAAAIPGRAAAVAAVNIRDWEEAVNMEKEEPIELKEQTLWTCLTHRSGGHWSLVEAV